MTRAYVECADDFNLVLHGKDRNEALKIRNKDYPNTGVAKELFSQLGTMHHIARTLPDVIQTSFPMSIPVMDLVKEMYKAEGAGREPVFVDTPADSEGPATGLKTSPKKAVIAYSAGKDSIWNYWWASKEYGPDNVMVVHISGLNRSNASYEREYSKLQAERLGFRHFRIVDLANGSSNGGYLTMRSRDIFLTGILVPLALEFGAANIITEGFAEATPTEPFTGRESVMHLFNRTLKKMGIPVAVTWRNLPEMDVVRELIENTRWLRHVHNCFSAPCYKPGIRRSWARNAPTFPLYESQCGSCVKCRITNLARVLYDKDLGRRASAKDVRYFVASTIKWIRERGDTHSDMMTPSFIEYLKRAAKECQITTPIPDCV